MGIEINNNTRFSQTLSQAIDDSRNSSEETPKKRIVLLQFTHPIVIEKLTELGFEVLTTENFQEVNLRDLKNFDFQSIADTDEITNALMECGFLETQSLQAKQLAKVKSTLVGHTAEFLIKAIEFDEKMLYRKEPDYISNKDRFYDKRRWRK